MRDTIIEVLEFVGKCLQYPDLPSFAFGFLPKASAENIYCAQKLIRLASDDSVEFRVMELRILVENFDLDPNNSNNPQESCFQVPRHCWARMHYMQSP
jgi:hypothetical protein